MHQCMTDRHRGIYMWGKGEEKRGAVVAIVLPLPSCYLETDPLSRFLRPAPQFTCQIPCMLAKSSIEFDMSS